MATKTRYEELKQQTHSHNDRYHVLDASIISDLGFDRLLNEPKQIESESGARPIPRPGDITLMTDNKTLGIIRLLEGCDDKLTCWAESPWMGASYLFMYPPPSAYFTINRLAFPLYL